MNHFTFKAAGLSGAVRFKVEGELLIDDHESAVDAAALCVRQQLGNDKVQFTKIAVKQIVPKPYGWEITYEARCSMTMTEERTVNRSGSVGKARMAARLSAGFVRIVKERAIATRAEYIRAFGDHTQKM